MHQLQRQLSTLLTDGIIHCLLYNIAHRSFPLQNLSVIYLSPWLHALHKPHQVHTVTFTIGVHWHCELHGYAIKGGSSVGSPKPINFQLNTRF